MLRFIKRKNIPPCKECEHCIIKAWKNLFNGKEQEICCKIKSNNCGDYCSSYLARGSKQCSYKEGTPTILQNYR